MNSYVLVSGDFVPWGGMDRANYELARYLAEEVQANVHLVAYHVASPLAEHPHVTWHKVKKPFNKYLLAEPLLRRTGREVARRLGTKEARVIVNGGNCAWSDVNWIHAAHCAWERRDRHAPALFRWRAAWTKQWARHNELAALAMARVVITNSESARQQVIEKLGLPPNRVRAIYYGADACAFRPPTPEEKQRARRHFQWSADQPLAIFIGALGHDRNKGFDLLFAAWEQLCQQGKWDVNLVAFGGGAEVELWREQASQKGLASRVKMMGFSKEIATALTGADILISPSHYEAYGLGVQEALCCGLPALVTRTAGVAEHYPPELHNLLLNDPPQVEDLVTRLRQWRGNMAEERCRVAQLSRTLRQRSWSDMAREIVEVIDRQ